MNKNIATNTSHHKNDRRRRHLLWLVALLLLANTLTQAWLAADRNPSQPPLRYIGFQKAPPLLSELVVMETREDGPFARAGIQQGDLLRGWSRPASNPPGRAVGEEFHSFVDWFRFVNEESWGSPLNLVLERDGTIHSVKLSPGPWEARVRPRFAGVALMKYLKGRSLVSIGDLDAASAVWRELAKSSGPEDSLLEWWLELHIATLQKEARKLEASEEALRRALLATPTPLAQLAAMRRMGALAETRQAWDRAAVIYDEAVHLGRNHWSRSLLLARDLTNNGRVVWRLGDLREAAKLLIEAREILQVSAPQSLMLVENLVLSAKVSQDSGRTQEAGTFLEPAMAILNRRPQEPSLIPILGRLSDVLLLEEPQQAKIYALQCVELVKDQTSKTLEAAQCLLNLARAKFSTGEEHGDLHVQGAFDIVEKLAPKSFLMAEIQLELGSIAEYKSELSLAKEHLEESVAIHSQLPGLSQAEAASLRILGMIQWRMRDLKTAEQTHRQGLAIVEELSPGAQPHAHILHHLGWVSQSQKKLHQARAYFERALEIRHRLIPGTGREAYTLNSLGSVNYELGELEKAFDYTLRSLEIRERENPGSREVMFSLQVLGQIATARGDLTLAQQYLERALRIARRLFDESPAEAHYMYELALVLRRMDRVPEAEGYFVRALKIQEQLAGSLEISHDAKARFRTIFLENYWHLIDLLTDTERVPEALALLEQSRATSFRALLAERKLSNLEEVRASSTNELSRLATQRSVLRQALEELESSETINAMKIEATERELLAVEQRRDQLEEELAQKIQNEAGELSRVELPPALRKDEISQSLESGTVALIYNVGQEKTHLFLVQKDQTPRAFTLAVGMQELHNATAHLRRLIKRVKPRQNANWARFVEQSRQLYEILIRPVEQHIESSHRLLIIPDRGLHLLPFNALLRATSGSGAREGVQKATYLIEWKPLHVALSITVYSQLQLARRPPEETTPGEVALVAFANPHNPRPLLRRKVDSSKDPANNTRERLLTPLKYSFSEVTDISKYFPNSHRIFKETEATEEQAKTILPRARIIHFAVHGVYDAESPMDSSLILSRPTNPSTGQEDGDLQAWEVLQQLKLQCDLVVLSACSTGVGQELGSDGLLGLTRAFQIAGAPSVVASQWDVPGRTTAQLMRRFYFHLNAGTPKDEALRHAQIDLLRNASDIQEDESGAWHQDVSSPYYWAGFQLYGDWR